MEPFKISNQLKEIVDNYPDAKLVSKVAKNGGEVTRIAIARQWLSEGIPFAFKDYPGMYESVRTWLAVKLGVNAKEISITGSARLGQSLSPSKLGTPFNDGSDLDLLIISNRLFDQLCSDYNKWCCDFDNDSISPKNDRERIFWKNNYHRGVKNITRGFIDSNLVPNYGQYARIQNISQTMWLLKRKFDCTPNCPKISRASVRCYKSWDSYVQQVSLNLT